MASVKWLWGNQELEERCGPIASKPWGMSKDRISNFGLNLPQGMEVMNDMEV